MTGTQIHSLIQAGATDRVRKKLIRMGLRDRLKTLDNCIPYIKASSTNLNFFRKNFSVEIGALISAERNITKAERLYRTAKSMK